MTFCSASISLHRRRRPEEVDDNDNDDGHDDDDDGDNFGDKPTRRSQSAARVGRKFASRLEVQTNTIRRPQLDELPDGHQTFLSVRLISAGSLR